MKRLKTISKEGRNWEYQDGRQDNIRYVEKLIVYGGKKKVIMLDNKEYIKKVKYKKCQNF